MESTETKDEAAKALANGHGEWDGKPLDGEAKSIEDMHEDGEGLPEPEPMLTGTTDQLTLNVGGRKKPKGSMAKLKSGQIGVTGQFTPDDVIELRVLARVDKVEVVLTRDGDGGIKDIKRVHHFTPLKIERASEAAVSSDAF